MRGTLVNAVFVAAGGLVGMGLGRALPAPAVSAAMVALGVFTLFLGLRLAWPAKNVLVLGGALAAGGVIGALLGLSTMLARLAQATGGESVFQEGLIASYVLFCVGPMTLIGCMRDGLDGDPSLLYVKSAMDGLSAILFGATVGGAILVTAGLVLLTQGGLTLAARLVGERVGKEAAEDAGEVGGLVMVMIAFGLLGIKSLPAADFLPALVIAPFLGRLARKRDG